MTVTKLDLKVTADAKAAVAGLKPLTTSLEGVAKTADKTESALNDLDKQHTLKVNDQAVENARKEIARLRNEIRRKLSVDATADTRVAERRIRQLQSSIRTLDRQDPTITVKADTKQAEGSLSSLKDSVKTLLGATAAIAGGKKLFEAAKAADQYTNNLKGLSVVVGDVVAQDLSAWAEDNGDALNISQEAAVEAGKGFSVYAKSVQDAGGDATKFTTDLIRLSTELAAFSGASPDEVITSLAAALRGEFDPLERFNIALTAAQVEARALELGLIDVGDEMTQQAKTQATYSLLMERGAFAMGSVERNAGSLTGALADLNQKTSDVGKTVGKSLVPALVEVVHVGVDAIEVLNKLVEVQDKLSGGTEELSDGFSGFIEAMRRMFTGGMDDVIGVGGDIVQKWKDVWEFGPVASEEEKAIKRARELAKEQAEGSGKATFAAHTLADAHEGVGRAAQDAHKQVMNSVEGQAAELERLKGLVSTTADAFGDIGKNQRTELQIAIDQDDLREDISEAVKKGVTLPKGGVKIAEVQFLSDAQQDALRTLSDIAEKGLEKGALLAEIDPKFDPQKFDKGLRASLKKQILKLQPEMSTADVNAMIDDLLLGSKDASIPILADLTAAIKALNNFLIPPAPLVVPVNANTGPAILDLNSIPVPSINIPVNADTGETERELNNLARDRYATVHVTYDSSNDAPGENSGGRRATLGSIIPQLLGSADTVAGLRGVSSQAMVATTAPAPNTKTSTRTGTVTQIAPRQVPIKIYLDGAEIADHLTLKAGRLAAASSVRRRA
jgi:hypothetical protein